jgi:hypothetical protein
VVKTGPSCCRLTCSCSLLHRRRKQSVDVSPSADRRR